MLRLMVAWENPALGFDTGDVCIRLNRASCVIALGALLVGVYTVVFASGQTLSSARLLAYFFSHLGNVLFILLTVALLLTDSFRRRAWRHTVFILGSIILIFAVVQVFKLAFGWVSPRPTGGHSGFPSGHAAISFALAFLFTQRFQVLAPLWYGIAIVISWSRVELGYHYAYQVVGGEVIGLAIMVYLHYICPLTPAFSHLRRGST